MDMQPPRADGVAWKSSKAVACGFLNGGAGDCIGTDCVVCPHPVPLVWASHPQTAEKWYNDGVLSGRRKLIPIDKTLQSNRLTKLRNFLTDDTDAEVCAHTRAPLFVFRLRHPKASSEIGERPFTFEGRE